MRSAIAFCLLFASSATAAAADLDAVDVPRAIDKRLAIELVAREPRIVTPIGIAVDGRGRVFVVESHTHFRPANYQGPPADRIRVFEDVDGDGSLEKITTFFEGTKSTMNLGFHPDGSLYVATRSEVLRLRDKDNDGKADERTSIVRLETSGDYPHNGLAGLAFDLAGNVYLGFGENLGVEYKLIGADGKKLTGGGEGGNIYRCRADGSELARIATGFWNPFALARDVYGRLFAVDNDPDSRPPCRLLHVVDGGDYGFKFRLGRQGLHPFIAWDGENPGTLPMVAGTGEAPSGMLFYESDNLPDDYRGDLLITSWGDHRIERHRLKPHGASVRSTAEPVIVGGENFRPVGIALAPDGSLYITDWMSKEYNLHGKGRIWRIRKSGASATSKPDRPDDPAKAILSQHRPLRESAAIQLWKTKDGRKLLRDIATTQADMRVRAVAIEVTAAGGWPLRYRWSDGDGSPELRAMAVRLTGGVGIFAKPLADAKQPAAVRAEAIRLLTVADDWRFDSQAAYLTALDDSDAFVRHAARQALVSSMRVGLKWSADDLAALRKAAQREGVLLAMRASGDEEYRVWLPTFLNDTDVRVRFAAVQWIGEEKLAKYRRELVVIFAAGVVTRPLVEAYLAATQNLDQLDQREPWDVRRDKQLATLALNDKTRHIVRKVALRSLRPDHPALTIDRLRELISSDDGELALEAVRTLRDSYRKERETELAKLAGDAKGSRRLRAEAVVGLTGTSGEGKRLLEELARGDDATLKIEALRSLRAAKPETLKRPAASDIDAWLKLVEGNGDAEAGERVFYRGATASCAKCHQIEGRGGRVGPDLSLVGVTMDRRKLIESLVAPSREIAPQFVTWRVAKRDGSSFTGVFVGEDGGRNQVFADAEGRLIRVTADEIEDRRPLEASLMPDGALGQLTDDELRDLLAFLLSRGKLSPRTS